MQLVLIINCKKNILLEEIQLLHTHLIIKSCQDVDLNLIVQLRQKYLV